MHNFFLQQPGIGGEVVPHQDNTFLYTQPTTCTGLWLALEDATVVNGCLWAIPGSHKSTSLHLYLVWPSVCFVGMPKASIQSNWYIVLLLSDGLIRRFIRDEKGVHFDKPSPSYDQKDFVPIEVKAGDLVVIHGDLIHQRLVIWRINSYLYTLMSSFNGEVHLCSSPVLIVLGSVSRTSHQNQGMRTACMLWTRMAVNGLMIIGKWWSCLLSLHVHGVQLVSFLHQQSYP